MIYAWLSFMVIVNCYLGEPTVFSPALPSPKLRSRFSPRSLTLSLLFTYNWELFIGKLLRVSATIVGARRSPQKECCNNFSEIDAAEMRWEKLNKFLDIAFNEKYHTK